ncbi:MAG TPA: sulfotransferase domain-containing protein, partial [Verrucomicrobiae bacterium]|nr:sulfotransferase domain-containing protein [Verrucomicrobiae bacterium]
MGDNPNPSASWTRLAAQAVKPALQLLAQPQNLAQLPRLFTEGLGPVRRLFIQAHNQREITRLILGGEQVNFVSSFARSGNTWTRNLLADALLQAQGIETNTDLPVPFQQVVPDFYCDMIARRKASLPIPGILVKTHDVFEQLRARVCGQASPMAELRDAAFRNCKLVYLFRRPEDVLVSYYHLQRKVKYIKRAQFSIDEFCRSHLPHWMDNLSGYVRAHEAGYQVFFVSYEAMLREPAVTLSDILRWL